MSKRQDPLPLLRIMALTAEKLPPEHQGEALGRTITQIVEQIIELSNKIDGIADHLGLEARYGDDNE